MEGLANRLTEACKRKHYTQAEVAEKLDVSFQAVSLWERDETTPDTEKLVDIAKLYGVTVDWLLLGKTDEVIPMDFGEPLSDRLFHEEHMYTYIKTYATLRGMKQTMKVLPFARKLHEGQIRKGKDKVPYIYHPLLIACHALALGLENDDIISTALLHDVCEDCDVLVDDLPVGEAVKEAVALLTKDKSRMSEEDYYKHIADNEVALIVKLLDRCNNVSGMASGFSRKKLVEYINETEKWIYPLFQIAKTNYPEYSNQIFLIKYHMTSVIGTLKYQLVEGIGE